MYMRPWVQFSTLKKKKSNQIKHVTFNSNEYANVRGNTKQHENNVYLPMLSE